MNIFADFFLMIDEHLDTYFNATLDAIMGTLSATVTTFAVIAVILGGIGVMFGRGAMSPYDWIKSLGIIVLVSILVSSGAEFNTHIAQYLRALPDFMLEQSTAGAGGGTIGERLDAIVRKGLDGFSALWAGAGWRQFGIIMIAIVLFITLLLFSVAAAITLVISKVGLTLVVVMGPFLLPALFFDVTKDLFMRWLTYALSFAAMAFLVGGVMGVADSVISEYMESMLLEREDFDPALYFAPIAVLSILAFLFSQLPGMASSLTGGIAVTAGSALQRAARAATAPLRRTIGERMDANRGARMREKTAASTQRRRARRNRSRDGGSLTAA